MIDFDPYDIEVELTLFIPEEGGRKTGFPIAFNGPHIYLDNCEWLAWFTLQDRERLNPEETGLAFVTFFYRPYDLLGRLHPGKPFSLHEGYHPIGKGRILSLLNFEKHVEEARQREEETSARLKQLPPFWERPGYRRRKSKKKDKR